MKPTTIARIAAILVLLTMVSCQPTDENDDSTDGEPQDDDTSVAPDDDNNDQTTDDDNDSVEPVAHDGAFALWAVKLRGNFLTGSVMRFDGARFHHEYPPGTWGDYGDRLQSVSGWPNESVIAVGDYFNQYFFANFPVIVYYDGQSWADVSTYVLPFTDFSYTSCSGVDRCYFVGHTETPGGISHYVFGVTNGKTIEVKQVGAEDSWLHTVWASATDIVWAVGSQVEQENNTVKPLVARWENGVFEETLLDEFGCSLSVVAGRNDLDLFASGQCGGDGLLYHYDGAGWTKILTGMEEDRVFGGIWFGEPELVYVFARNLSTDDCVLLVGDGAEWQTMEIPDGVGVQGVWVRRADDVYISHDGGLLHFNGESWENIRGPSLRSLWGYEIPPRAEPRQADGVD